MLTEGQLKDIERLQMIVEQTDRIELKLNWYFLRSRVSTNNDFFYYEGDQLLGFLALYYVGGAYEMCGMVHPDHRQKGIFSELFQRVLNELQNRKSQTLYINSPPESDCAKKTLTKMGATYAYSEYQMRWQKQDLPEPSVQVKLVPAVEADYGTILELDQKGFNLEKEEARLLNKTLYNDPGHRIYMIENEDGEKVGKLRIKSEGIESYIFGFTVDPDYRRQGIGLSALIQAVGQEAELGHTIFVEVGTEDVRGLHLYEAVGFKTFQQQDYYKYEENMKGVSSV
ncbi:GNAT family N-acetyltransferase [Tenuibacillus multivorans]|uniref:Acetyltransferase (GNAT) domain-containing protein n=1 Tax=Tenuibacillus multivorans TaxID=237069 RepID=A0A1H0AQZ2_9BACI|nr:GNAT family N-acetyltransferase [Tenuibacillus multivorans]GEL78233.1 GNAT family N-acetyltransferase [Tenuibacillus multivorans]SDN35523.1 Acetyltransferase (GNAT) domain-containing protein [Tenuibacillus multivorans]